ncbi:MAG: hypothetical protein R3B84_24050 [Zavarzinella sp.]
MMRLAITFLFLAATVGATEPVRFQRNPAGKEVHVEISTKLQGYFQIIRGGKPVKLAVSANNQHRFEQISLKFNEKQVPTQAVRWYETAESKATIDGESNSRTLSDKRRQIVVDRTLQQLICYSLEGPLTQQDLEMVAEHYDTLPIVGLLPEKPVALNDTWKIDPGVVQSLCLFDALTEQDLQATFKSQTDTTATIAVSGTAKGIERGALATLTITAAVTYDKSTEQISAIQWQQRDVRQAGPMTPAANLESETNVVVKPQAATHVPAGIASKIPAVDRLPQAMASLFVREPAQRYELMHHREWQMIAANQYTMIMRLMQRGDFIAQLSITYWKKLEAGKNLGADQFVKEISSLPGWEMLSITERGEIPNEEKRWTYRVVATGKLNGQPVTQHFYCVAAPNGQHVLLTFTGTADNMVRLSTRDLEIVNSLVINK